MVSESFRREATQEELLARARDTFFPDADEQFSYFLADSGGYKIGTKLVTETTWTLGKYLELHGFFPSTTKLYCVQVPRGKTKKEKVRIQSCLSGVGMFWRNISKNTENLTSTATDDLKQTTESGVGEVDATSEAKNEGEVLTNCYSAAKSKNAIKSNQSLTGATELHMDSKAVVDSLKLSETDITISKQIGMGSFGVIYEAALNGIVVAVKISLGGASEESKQLAYNEIATLVRLRHPNIITVMGVML
jgi:hypothetical protein